MKLIDADALKKYLDTGEREGSQWRSYKEAICRLIDAVPFINCAADNPHGLVPSRCPTCGEELVPYPCMDLAQDSYRDGILYGQEHPEWRVDT